MSYLDEIKARYDIKDYVEPKVNIPELPTEGIVLIAGTSGSGKTTLVDLLIGVIKPVSGEINISGYKPAETIKLKPR